MSCFLLVGVKSAILYLWGCLIQVRTHGLFYCRSTGTYPTRTLTLTRTPWSDQCLDAVAYEGSLGMLANAVLGNTER